LRFILPGQPLRRVVPRRMGVVHHLHQIVGGLNAVSPAGLDRAQTVGNRPQETEGQRVSLQIIFPRAGRDSRLGR
jgi:hypothetical protein